jgi:hypothetical protein
MANASPWYYATAGGVVGGFIKALFDRFVARRDKSRDERAVLSQEAELLRRLVGEELRANWVALDLAAFVGGAPDESDLSDAEYQKQRQSLARAFNEADWDAVRRAYTAVGELKAGLAESAERQPDNSSLANDAFAQVDVAIDAVEKALGVLDQQPGPRKSEWLEQLPTETLRRRFELKRRYAAAERAREQLAAETRRLNEAAPPELIALQRLITVRLERGDDPVVIHEEICQGLQVAQDSDLRLIEEWVVHLSEVVRLRAKADEASTEADIGQSAGEADTEAPP